MHPRSSVAHSTWRPRGVWNPAPPRAWGKPVYFQMPCLLAEAWTPAAGASLAPGLGLWENAVSRDGQMQARKREAKCDFWASQQVRAKGASGEPCEVGIRPGPGQLGNPPLAPSPRKQLQLVRSHGPWRFTLHGAASGSALPRGAQAWISAAQRLTQSLAQTGHSSNVCCTKERCRGGRVRAAFFTPAAMGTFCVHTLGEGGHQAVLHPQQGPCFVLVFLSLSF